MFSVFNKKEIKPENPPAPPVFVDGKPIEYRDPKTGEFVSQRPIPEESRKAIMNALAKNGQAANQAIQLFRQFNGLLKVMAENDNFITVTEKEINDSVIKARDELKLDGRWGLNPNLMVLEKKDPPVA